MERTLTLGERLRRANWLLLALGIMLSLVGVMTVGAAAQHQRLDYGWLQVRWTVIGIALCLLMLAIPYRTIVAWRFVIYAVGLMLLIAVLFLGRGGRTAQRWLQLGPLRMQPSELMKVVMVLMLAGFIRYRDHHKRFSGLFWPILLTLIPMALIVKQPDLGTALLLLPVLFVMLWVAGANPRHLAILALSGIVLAVFVYMTPGILRSYQKNRVRAFAMQESEATALAKGQLHHLLASKTVVGTASFGGAGVDEDLWEHTRYLPERHSDFIFPVFIAAFGQWGVALLFLLMAVFVFELLRTSLKVREPSGRLLAVGLATLFASQSLINMGMTIGLFPIVGMPMPFLSYGGSSLLTSFIALGLVLNVGADHPVEFGRGDFD
jgi:rod shape determining protein RodA